MALVVSSALVNPTAALQAALTDFEKGLSDSQRRNFLTHVHHAHHGLPDPSTVMQFVAELDAANHGALRMSVAPRLCTFLDAVQQFTTVVDTFVSSNPALAALVWGGVKTAILAACNVAQYFDKVTAIIMKIGKICPLYHEFAGIYYNSVALQSAISDYYAVVVRLATRIVEVMQRNQITQFLSSIVDPFESAFSQLQDRLLDSAKLVKLQVSLAASRAALRSSELAVLESKKNKVHRALFRNFESDFRTGQSESQIRRQLQEAARMKLSIRIHLSTVDHRKIWKQTQRRRHKDTAVWFRNEKGFQDWQADPGTAILWCPGKMGIGKTVLVSNIISYLSRTIESTQLLSYHFCRAEHDDSTSARNVLGTIACQLLDQHINEAEGNDLEELHLLCEHADPEDITNILLSRLRPDQDHYMIVDGLDECAETEVVLLIQNICKLRDDRSLRFYILLSGRPELQQTVLRAVDAKYRMEISPAVIRTDIERYIEDTLFDYLNDQRIQLSNHEVILSIASLLNERYSDMFLFAHLFIEELCTLVCETDIVAALQNPPQSVDDLIRQKMNRVRSQDFSETAIKVIQYCGITKRPLTIYELGELLSLSASQLSLDRASIPCNMYRIVAACRGLAFIDEEDETVHYVHHSLRHHLFASVGGSIAVFHKGEVETRLGHLCLTYLNFSDFDRRLVRWQASHVAPVAPLEIGTSSIRKSNQLINKAAQILLRSRGKLQQLSPTELKQKTERVLGEDMSKQLEAARQKADFHLLDYVQQFWIYHVAGLTPEADSKAWHLFRHFVESDNGMAVKPWMQKGSDWPDSSATWAVKHSHTALLMVVVTHHLQKVGTDRVQEILDFAICGNHQRLADPLIGYAKDSTCLILEGIISAARCGKMTWLDLFLQERVNPSGLSREGRLAIQVAAGYGHLDIVERLLAAGADVNACAKDNTTALHAAVHHNHLGVVEHLLNAGADVNAQSVHAITPLHLAAEAGHLDVVERLLAAGADTRSRGSITALDWAVDSGHLNVVKRLLAAGVDINARHKDGGTALHLAAYSGHLDVVEHLLAVGADVTARNQSAQTAHDDAISQGYFKVAQLLEKGGAAYT